MNPAAKDKDLPKRAKTVNWCKSCEVFLCIASGNGKHVSNRWKHKRMPVTCPALVKAYNMYMGGTDKSDQRIKLQRCRHHYKWPRRLMVKFFVWSAFNGYIIQNLCKPRIIQGKPIQTFRMFIDELCDDLVGSHRRALVPICQDARLQETKHGCIANQTSLFTY